MNCEMCEISPNIHSKKCWVKSNPTLGKYWTEHMPGYFDPAGWVNVFTQHAGLFYLSQLLFKKYYIIKQPNTVTQQTELSIWVKTNKQITQYFLEG